jgi:flagellar motor switch protein FliN
MMMSTDDMDIDWASAFAEQEAAEAATKAAPPPPAAPSGPAFPGMSGPATPVSFPSLSGSNASSRHDVEMIMDIPVQLTVELGRTKLPIKSLLQLAQGSVVELDGFAGEPMDVLINGCLIAQGEVVVVNEKFGIRLTDIITPSERIRKLNR